MAPLWRGRMTDWGVFQVHEGDCLDVLRAMPDNSVDSCVTDPPYGLSFMGSGSTGKGAVLAGFRFIGIERDPTYAAIAVKRIARALYGDLAA